MQSTCQQGLLHHLRWHSQRRPLHGPSGGLLCSGVTRVSEASNPRPWEGRGPPSGEVGDKAEGVCSREPHRLGGENEHVGAEGQGWIRECAGT